MPRLKEAILCLPFIAGPVLGISQHAMARQEEPSRPRSDETVGMSGTIKQLVLPGTELEVKPLDDRRAPFILRIAAAYPHGSAYRYDFVYYALEPGQYDLRDYLRRKDNSALGHLPPIVVQVDAVLPPGQIEPHPLALEAAPALGGYRLILAIGGSLWFTGLAAILLLGRRKRGLAAGAGERPLDLADRLRPLVDAALAGTLDQARHAELERLLYGYWRKKLHLEQASPAEVIRQLRSHPEAGPLIRKLEEWLHRPAGAAAALDVEPLLRPYQGLKADAREEDAVLAGPAPTRVSSMEARA
jgi:hypothetical protein